MSDEVKALVIFNTILDVSLKMLDVSEILERNGDKSLAVKILKEVNAILDDVEKLLDE